MLLEVVYLCGCYYYNFYYYQQGIYNYVPETNHVSKVCNVAAVLYIQFVLHVMLFRMCTFYIGAWGDIVVKALRY
jgi:hypothetical protein